MIPPERSNRRAVFLLVVNNSDFVCNNHEGSFAPAGRFYHRTVIEAVLDLRIPASFTVTY